VFFNILAARLYGAFMKIIDYRGLLFALSDDVNMVAPSKVLADIVARLPSLAISEAGLKTHASKNRVYDKPSARAESSSDLETNPRSEDATILSLHDIPNGHLPPPSENNDAFYGNTNGPTLPANDGINILGTPLGSPAFVEEYIIKISSKHGLLISFI
jgi:hypothetical protein